MKLELISGKTNSLSLDEMWKRAANIGAIEIDRDIFGDRYSVTISFDLASGSSVRAMGRHDDIYVAFGMAIEEAEKLND